MCAGAVELSLCRCELCDATVRGLAAKLNVTKPVITRALDAMGARKLVTRHRDPRDKRNVVISRTVEGSQYLERFADLIITKARDLPL